MKEDTFKYTLALLKSTYLTQVTKSKTLRLQYSCFFVCEDTLKGYCDHSSGFTSTQLCIMFHFLYLASVKFQH